jgi:HEAT repeat protein/RNA polymerase subunit RPABC4/transcription elongation factor Spt4
MSSNSLKSSVPGDLDPGAPRPLATGEVDRLVVHIRNGDLSSIDEVLDRLGETRPESAITHLLRIALGQDPADDLHQLAAVQALGRIGGPAAVQALVKIKAPPERIWTVCCALGNIGEDGGLPYLFDIMNNGITILPGSHLELKQLKMAQVLALAYAIMAASNIDSPLAISPLVMSATSPLFSQVLAPSQNGARLDQVTVLAVALAVDRNVDLESMIGLSDEILRIWLFQLRRKALVSLGKNHSKDQIQACYLQALVGAQRLMVALSLVDLGVTDRHVFDALAQSTQSLDTIERILAYDGFITAASMFHLPNLIEWGKVALADRNMMVRLAAAGSALYNFDATLARLALKFLESPVWEERFALLFPIQSLAVSGDENAEKILSDMAHNDRDDSVRGMASQLLEQLPMKRAFYMVNVAKAHVAKALKQASNDLTTLSGENPAAEPDPAALLNTQKPPQAASHPNSLKSIQPSAIPVSPQPSGRSWYEWLEGTSNSPQDMMWSAAMKPAETSAVKPVRESALSSAEVDGLVRQILSGDKDNLRSTMIRLRTARPKSAVPALMRIAQGAVTKDPDRMYAAIEAIGHIADPSAIQGLVEIKKPPELGIHISWALGQIGHPAGLAYLFNIINNELSIPFTLFIDTQTQNTIKLQALAHAMVAVGEIGRPEAVTPLVMSALKDSVSSFYSDDTSGDSSNLLIFVAETAMKNHAANKATAMASYLMVDPTAPLWVIINYPGEVRRMWMLQLRRKVLGVLLKKCGPESLVACLPQARAEVQRLLLALAMLDSGASEQVWWETLSSATRSAIKSHRILAYDGYISRSAVIDHPDLHKWGKLGLEDRDSTVRSACAASVLFHNVKPLIPLALNFARSSSVNERISILAPLKVQAIRGDQRAVDTLSGMRSQDPDKRVREMASIMLDDLDEIRVEYRRETSSDLPANADPKVLPVIEPEQSQPTLSTTAQSSLTPSPVNLESLLPSRDSALPWQESEMVETTSCDECGKTIPFDALECPYCHVRFDGEDSDTAQTNPSVETPLVPIPPSDEYEFTCSNCGAVVPEEATYCPKCGTSFDEEEDASL